METSQSRVVNLTSLVEPNGTIEWTDIGYACDCILIHACNLQMLPQARPFSPVYQRHDVQDVHVIHQLAS